MILQQTIILCRKIDDITSFDREYRKSVEEEEFSEKKRNLVRRRGI